MWAGKDPSVGESGQPSGAASTGDIKWQGFNLAAHHNAAYPDPAMHYPSDRPGGACPGGTTSYTGMVVVPGENAVFVSYDRLANGWNPARWPPVHAGDVSGLFTVRLNVTV